MADDGKYSSESYLRADPFSGDRDVDVRAQRVRLVRIRKKHRCHLCRSYKKPGTVMYRETAVVDGEWSTCHCCLPCLDRNCLDEDPDSYDPKPPGRRVIRPAPDPGKALWLEDVKRRLGEWARRGLGLHNESDQGLSLAERFAMYEDVLALLQEMP